jgi:hypothetical protein
MGWAFRARLRPAEVQERHELPRYRRRRQEGYKRWERSRPMELWQIVLRGVRLADGTHGASVDP